jgi:hypothetical protein
MKGRLLSVCIYGAFVGGLLLGYWLVFVAVPGTWQDQAGLLLQLLGVFALATAFVERTGVADDLPDGFVSEMTSPYPRKYIAGQYRLVALTMAFGRAYVYGRSPWEGLAPKWKAWLFPLWLLVALLQLIGAVLLVLAALAYVVLLAPFAYPAYAIVGFVLISIRDGRGEETPLIPGFDPRDVIRGHPAQLRGFLVFAATTIASFALKLAAL